MHDVIQCDDLRMLLMKQFDPFFQVRTTITEDGSRYTTCRGQFLKLPMNDRAIGLLDRDQGQRL